jgi:hypothetical protein
VGREVVEEIWFMSILSVTSFPRVYGRTASGPAARRARERWQNRSLSSGL